MFINSRYFIWYGGKMPKVTLEVEGVNDNDAARAFIEEIANQYADLSVENINISSNQITFDVNAPGMEDTTAEDIKFRIDEFISMNVPPFTVKSVNVS
ncbi:MAG: hypothetical protein D6752_00600 [Candidatus Nitrosothermus koennekii]|nr:MAG: hypothetical protein D6752_00600 [Candidatus Nitrosothermus koennekii]